MPELPSFFNRIDFIRILLPGYIPIISYLIIFRPAILFSEKPISFDIFSSVVFIVAGPALGLTLLQLHRGLFIAISIVSHKVKKVWEDWKGKKGKKNKRKEADGDEKFYEEYARVRLGITGDERVEFDETEAFYDFSISTSIALFGLSSFGFITLGMHRFEFFVLLGGALILLFIGYQQWSKSYSPMEAVLAKKYARSQRRRKKGRGRS